MLIPLLDDLWHRAVRPVDRRDFMKICALAAAAVGLRKAAAAAFADAARRGVKPSVIWLHSQECTGCSGVAAAHVPIPGWTSSSSI